MGGAEPVLRLGPLLRYVDETRATVWVETDRPCEVEILGHRARTWAVHGHHYALVLIEQLEPASETEYQVTLDGQVAWPSTEPACAAFGPSVIRTAHEDGAFRMAFGSCRRSEPLDAPGLKNVGPDTLVALATRLSRQPRTTWPDALLLLGDQVYADDPSDAVLARLREAHEGRLDDEVGNFEEYTWLYDDSWTPEAVRWLLSTVPLCMLLDDHDLRDDWNTSLTWRRWATAQPWWRDRVVGAYASYWIYQHLGNLSPEQLAEDATYAAMLAARSDAERSAYLDAFAWQADTDPATVRWSFYRDLGGRPRGIRLMAIDSRCSRVLEPAGRSMVDGTEWEWVRRHTIQPDQADQPLRHLLLASTLPFLLVPGLHHLEGWDEAISEGAWGARWSRAGEKFRQSLDLEHWASFRSSFDETTALLADVVDRPQAPDSVLMLSGDVHTSYVAEATLSDYEHAGTAIHQLTMSPFRNPVGPGVRLAIRLLNTSAMTAALRWLAHRAGVRDVAVTWRTDHGPWFRNGVMTVVIDGETVTAEVEHARGPDTLSRTARIPLTPELQPPRPRETRDDHANPDPSTRCRGDRRNAPQER